MRYLWVAPALLLCACTPGGEEEAITPSSEPAPITREAVNESESSLQPDEEGFVAFISQSVPAEKLENMPSHLEQGYSVCEAVEQGTSIALQVDTSFASNAPMHQQFEILGAFEYLCPQYQPQFEATVEYLNTDVTWDNADEAAYLDFMEWNVRDEERKSQDIYLENGYHYCRFLNDPVNADGVIETVVQKNFRDDPNSHHTLAMMGAFEYLCPEGEEEYINALRSLGFKVDDPQD